MNLRISLPTGVFFIFALIFLSGCAPEQRGPLPLAGIEKALEESETTSSAKPSPPELPPEVSAALLPPVISTEPMEEQERRFDIAASGTPAKEFFMGLVEGTPYNMVVHPNVQGAISLSLKNVTVGEVMDVVQNVYGYSFRRSESVFQVLPAGIQSRIFHVNYLNVTRRGTSQTRVSSGQVSQVASGDDSGSSGDSSPAASPNPSSSTTAVVSGSRIDTESIADFWQELRAALMTIVGTESGRKVVIQPQASVVLVRAMPEELRAVEEYLFTVQGNLLRQVILEAKILEVELNDGFQTGINWSALGNDASAVVGETSIGGNTIGGLSNSLINSATAPGFDGVFSAAVNFKDFTAFIELLKSQGDVQVLSSPRVATVNNQKAVIKVGSDEFFVTEVSTDTVTGTSTSTTSEVTLTPFFSGIALDVTPQIDATGLVTLHVHPTVSDVTDQTKFVTVGNDTQSLPLALSSVRESDSIVSARSGQVVVIGGLMENEVEKYDAAMPILGDIPLIGRAFQHTKSASRKSELVILVRPTVVEGGKTWDTYRQGIGKRVDSLGVRPITNW